MDQAQTRVDGFKEREPRKPTGPFAWLFRLIAAVLAVFKGKRKDDANARLQAENELAAARQAQGEVQFEVGNIRQRRTTAANQATAHGLPDDPEALRALAVQSEKASEAERDLRNWRCQETALRKKVDQEDRALTVALRARGVTELHPVSDALAAYEAACRECAEQFQEASRHSDLERSLVSRLEAETAAANDEEQRNEAIIALRQAGEGLALRYEDGERLATRLREWVQGHETAAPDRQHATEEWNELRNLLNEGGIEGLESAATNTREAAETAAHGLDEGGIDAAVLEADAETQLHELRNLESERRQALNTAQGQLREVARNLPSVPETEEEAERAKSELDRVTNLGNTLTKTKQFLEQAQDEVQRDIAPHLVEELTPWIEGVTGGRYSSVMVDPKDLMVRVSGAGGGLRDGTLLSHGTTEQIYLLLRVAMASLLTKASGETCPLLLDDVTVHCDSERQTAILNLLQKISCERQVILFSQEPETLAWAEQHLQRGQVRLVKLPGGIPA